MDIFDVLSGDLVEGAITGIGSRIARKVVRSIKKNTRKSNFDDLITYGMYVGLLLMFVGILKEAFKSGKR